MNEKSIKTKEKENYERKVLKRKRLLIALDTFVKISLGTILGFYFGYSL